MHSDKILTAFKTSYLYQGYHFSHPMPADEITKLLREQARV